jgi:hypothetical protein
VCHALTSFGNFLCVPASSETPASRRKHKQHQRRRFRNGGIHNGTGATTGGLAEAALQKLLIPSTGDLKLDTLKDSQRREARETITRARLHHRSEPNGNARRVALPRGRFELTSPFRQLSALTRSNKVAILRQPLFFSGGQPLEWTQALFRPKRRTMAPVRRRSHRNPT